MEHTKACRLFGLFVCSAVLFFVVALGQNPEFYGERFTIRFPIYPRCTLYIKEPLPWNETGQWFLFEGIHIAELAPTGTPGVYNTYLQYELHPFPEYPDGLNWTTASSSIFDPIAGGRVDNFNFTAFMPNNASIQFSTWYYQAGGSMYFAAADFEHTFPPDTFKFGAIISHWPFASPNNRIEIYIVFNSSEPLTLPVDNYQVGNLWISQPVPYNFGVSSSSSSSAATATDAYDPCAPKMNVTLKAPRTRGLDMKFLNFAEVDGVKVPLDWVPTLPGLDDGTESLPDNIHTIGHYFTFDAFNDTIIYDPDMTVLLGDDDDSDGESDECDGDGDGVDDSVPIAISISAIVLAGIIIVAIIIAGLLVFKVKRKRKESQLEAVDAEMKALESGASRSV